MPRKSRIDAPGALNHIIVRGINRQPIFCDDADRDKFLDRLGFLLSDTITTCFAWALVDNHFHLLLRTVATPLASVMRRLLTGYALYFNKRYQRNGPLFQNRYKSILCQEDAYLLELVRYIHLNPLRANLVGDFPSLATYPYCGHSAILGAVERTWQETEQVLHLFADSLPAARKRYVEYFLAGVDTGRRPDLVGGGLIRSQGGWTGVKEARASDSLQKGDERILGSSDFVEDVLRQSEEKYSKSYQLMAQGIDFDYVVRRVATLSGISTPEILTGDKKRVVVAARSVACFWAVKELGLSQSWLAKQLCISQPAVSSAVTRGKALVAENHYTLIDETAQ